MRTDRARCPYVSHGKNADCMGTPSEYKEKVHACPLWEEFSKCRAVSKVLRLPWRKAFYFVRGSWKFLS